MLLVGAGVLLVRVQEMAVPDGSQFRTAGGEGVLDDLIEGQLGESDGLALMHDAGGGGDSENFFVLTAEDRDGARG